MGKRILYFVTRALGYREYPELGWRALRRELTTGAGLEVRNSIKPARTVLGRFGHCARQRSKCANVRRLETISSTPPPTASGRAAALAELFLRARSVLPAMT